LDRDTNLLTGEREKEKKGRKKSALGTRPEHDVKKKKDSSLSFSHTKKRKKRKKGMMKKS